MGPSLQLPSLGCPCGSGATYAVCCGPVHRDLASATRAEQVMRARYSAFVRGDAAFLRASWDESTRPAFVDLDPELSWRGLEVIDTTAGGPHDEEGWVTFVARYRHGGRPGELRERSRFLRGGGVWRYVEGLD